MKHPYLLFIPFSVKENNSNLYLERARPWRYLLPDEAIKPEIVVYRRKDEIEKDYSYYDRTQFQFSLENIKPNTSLYVLAHGMHDPRLIVNTATIDKDPDGLYLMPIELVAVRMKEMGFTPELAQHFKSINLFVCGTERMNKNLAKNLSNALGPAYSNLTINFYTKTLAIPDVTTPHKKAIDPFKIFNPCSQVLDRASVFKKTIWRGQKLKEQSLSNNQMIEYFLKQNQAMEYSAFVKTFSPEQIESEENKKVSDNGTQLTTVGFFNRNSKQLMVLPRYSKEMVVYQPLSKSLS